MLRWTRKSLPAAGVLPLSPCQHDWRALRRARWLGPRLHDGRPIHRQRQRPHPGGRVPASPPTLHGSWSAAGGPLHRHGGHDEATLAKSGGRARHHSALVLLRSATDRQAALGPTQHFQGLCSSGDPKPAASTGACNTTRTHSRAIWTSSSGRSLCSASRGHAGGELIEARRWWCNPMRMTRDKAELKAIILLFCALQMFSVRRAMLRWSIKTTLWRKDSLFWFYTFFEVFLTVPMETKLQKEDLGFV